MMRYCIPENEVTRNLPVRSECIVSINTNTWMYAWLFIELSVIGDTVSSVDFSVSGNNDTNRLVDCCPCLIWSKCPNAVGVVSGRFADDMSLVNRGNEFASNRVGKWWYRWTTKCGVHESNEWLVILLFDGIEWYCAADAHAWGYTVGSVTCHSELHKDLSWWANYRTSIISGDELFICKLHWTASLA